MSYLATDVGGTFTDLVHYSPATGRISVAKTLTTPDDPSRGVMNAIQDGRTQGFIDATANEWLVHGGTTVINAITERKGVKTALITTAGFRDVLEIGRGNRPDLYNLHAKSPEPFVPRRWRFEVRERVGAKGEIVAPFEASDLEPIIAQCERDGIEAIAVVFLNSYLAPEHEQQCARLLRMRLPRVAITASHEISRQWREYERTNTTVLNAYVMPVVEHYFQRLSGALEAEGFRAPFYAMQSSGGVANFEWARSQPLTLVESGPAGGVSGAAAIGAMLDETETLYLDVGGTTAKCSVIHAGTPKLNNEYRLEWSRSTPGYPVQVPVVDIVEIGAGGGSIAWFDAAGSLRVGPRSAGALPGPACYGFGGTEPTVTDAKLITGVLHAEGFAGGSMSLDFSAAERAMEKVARPLGLSVVAAASAVIRVAEANMLNALRLVTIQRGHDPRELTLVASGGGGPMHAAQLARELGVARVVIPPYPGVFSAWGMLVSPPRRDLRRTHLRALDEEAIHAGARYFAEMRDEAKRYFNTAESNLRLSYSVEMRYRGQEHTVSAPCTLEQWNQDAVLAAFHQAHERAYTFRLVHATAEVVGYQLKAELKMAHPVLVGPAHGGDAEQARIGARSVDFGEAGRHDTAIYERDELGVNARVAGPALIEELSSTTVVLPGQIVTMNPQGLMILEEAAREHG